MVALVLGDLEQRFKSPGSLDTGALEHLKLFSVSKDPAAKAPGPLGTGVPVRRLPNTPLILAIFVSFAFIFF
jgi:hypothetical protein